MNRSYVGATSAVLAVLIGGAALWTTMTEETTCGGNAIAGGNVAIGGPFELLNGAGELVTDEEVIDGPALVYFGYTFCPDVCPTTLAETTAWRQALGLNEDDLRIIFVTVDPERDTPAVLQQYLTAFSGPIVGLTGSVEAIEGVKSAFGAVSEKSDMQSDSDYLVNHTASVFMIDAQGNLFGTIAFGENSDTARAKIERMVSG